MSHVEHSNFPLSEAKGLTSAKYITKRRRPQSNSRTVRQRQLGFQSTVPRKINVQSLPEDVDPRITSKLTFKEAPQSNSRTIRQQQFGFQSTVPRKINVQSLPEDVALRITSKLTFKEAARMSVLSSLWRQSCVFHPNLHFGIETVLGSHAERGMCSDPNNINRFIERVDAILKNHCGTHVNKFIVEFGLSTRHANHINRWVSFTVASKARAVILNLSPNRSLVDRDNYDFPFQLFNDQNGSYLQVLQLDSVTLGPSPDFCGFANLKKLDLYFVTVLQDLRHLLSKCCVLEWLRIRRCFGMSSLCIPEPLYWLQYLCLQNCAFHNIELHAPNLTTFEYRGSPSLMNLNECLKLKTATIGLYANKTLNYVLTGIPNILPHVETMHVELFMRNEMSGFTQSPLKIIGLKHLSMEISCLGDTKSVFQLAYLLEAAPLLQDLHLEIFGVLHPRCRPIDLDDIMDVPHCHLKTVCITGFCGDYSQVELAKYILKNALMLEHLILRPGGKYYKESTSSVHEFYGRKEAREKLAPLARDGVLTLGSCVFSQQCGVNRLCL